MCVCQNFYAWVQANCCPVYAYLYKNVFKCIVTKSYLQRPAQSKVLVLHVIIYKLHSRTGVGEKVHWLRKVD